MNTKVYIHKACLFLYGVLVAALLLQAALPRGYMPVAHGGKPFRLEICTAYGLGTLVQKDKDTSSSDSNDIHSGKKVNTVCPYGAMPVPLAFSCLVVLPFYERASDTVRQSLVSNIYSPLAKPWQAQAPPLNLFF